MAINNGRVYTFKDLEPMLEESNQYAQALNNMDVQKLYTEPVQTPKLPKEQRDTTAKMAEGGNWSAINQIKDAEKQTNDLVAKNQKVLNDYRAEMDRRNAIINRMKYLRGIMRDWYNSDTKNRLAGANMVKKSIEEYKQLSKEANKFMKYIKY